MQKKYWASKKVFQGLIRNWSIRLIGDIIVSLAKDYYDAEAVFDVSAGMDAEELARISERIEVFLRQKGASKSDANHTALCLEELAFLIVERNENSGQKLSKMA